MPTYYYTAINQSGNTVTGNIDADSVDTANQILVGRGYIPQKMTERTPGAGFWEGDFRAMLTPVQPLDLILFTKQLRTMLKAGIAIVHLLQVLENQTENPKLKKIIGKMALLIGEGGSLYDTFRKYPSVFPNLYCSMIRAGEQSGSLVEVLERLIYIIEHEHKVTADIKSALRYPVIVMLFLAVAFVVLLTVVIPKFITIFSKAGLDLPLPTRVCLLMYEFVSQWWPLIILGCGGVIVAVMLYMKTDKGRLVWDTLLLKIPILGTVFMKAAMSRFGSIFSILQASGVSILETMKILAGTIGNAAIASQLDRISSLMAEGRGIAEPLKSSKYFSPMVIHMVAVGEESGNLDELLREMSAHYDTEVEYAMKKLSDSIGPILTIALTVIVGFFALAIFLPMWDLTKLVK